MKVAILAGGVGSRLSEETIVKPKPMVEIGDRPILWHIMKMYAHHGFEDFVIALGYKGDIIKRWAIDYFPLAGDLTVDFRTGDVKTHERLSESWRVALVETDADTLTGGRIKRLQPHLGSETFMLTWGDGVSDIDLGRLLEFHRAHGRLVTMTAARPVARFGHIELEGDAVVEFSEKPQAAEGWINGAFFVCEPEVFGYIDGDQTAWEREPLERLAAERQLMAYRHESFWQCMDTLRDKVLLEQLWQGSAPWAAWRT